MFPFTSVHCHVEEMKFFVSFPVTLFLLWITLRVQGVLFRLSTKVGYLPGPYNYTTKYFDQQVRTCIATPPISVFTDRSLRFYVT